MDLRGRSLLKEIDFSAEEFLYLVDLGGRLRADKRAGRRARRLAGRIETAAGIPALVVDDPLRCVVRGAGEILEAGRAAAGLISD